MKPEREERKLHSHGSSSPAATAFGARWCSMCLWTRARRSIRGYMRWPAGVALRTQARASISHGSAGSGSWSKKHPALLCALAVVMQLGLDATGDE